MRFFLDENFPKTARALLSKEGHESVDIRGTDKEGSNDHDLFRMAQDSNAVFLTTDKDFFHTIPHLCPTHRGVVVVALHQPNRESILARLSWLLAHLTAEQIEGRVFLLRDASYVVYPPLDV
jgi:predicted nuclease of predicted toxin-antitoxin system